LLTGVLVSGLAWAQQWFAVIGPDAENEAIAVEVDLDSVRTRGYLGEAIVRASYKEPHQHPAGYVFRSYVARTHFDCRKRTISLIGADYFELPRGSGALLGTDDTAHETNAAQALLNSIPLSASHALLKATCAISPKP
jgi:hypothetical protein